MPCLRGFVTTPFAEPSRFSSRVPAVTSLRSLRSFATSLSHHPRPSFDIARPSQTRCSMASERFAVTRSDCAPSWEKLLAKGDPIDYINGPNCISPSKERESVRLFGQKEADVRIVLYRDHANWCPYCHKVQLLIEAKKIPYIVKKINLSCYGSKPEEFLKLVPTGLLPVILLDGKVITESIDIMFQIEDTFQTPYRRMIPADDNDMMQAFHRYMRLERVFIGAWLGALRGPLSMVNRGLEPVHHALDLVESCLEDFVGPFFYPGEEPSFVDINFSHAFERARSALKFWRNLEMTEGRPNLRRWFEAWNGWAPAMYLRSDDWTHIGALPPQIGPMQFGKTRNAASLSVETARSRYVMNDGPEGAVVRNLAGVAISKNHVLVVKDAIVGVKVSEKEQVLVDFAFRLMCEVLFDPDKLEMGEVKALKEIPKDSRVTVGNAIRFERARCCAPRDMPIKAMEQFCGVINWLLRTLGQEL